jgi:putative membrane protein
MKKLMAICVMAFAVYALQSCGSSTKTGGTADSTTVTKDSTSTSVTSTPAPDSTDAAFATKAAIGGMAEVALGKLAQQKSTTMQIQNFGAMMVTDHGKANDELKGIAKAKNITLPDSLDAEHQQKLNDLSALVGKDFDKAYVDAMIGGHKKVLMLMQGEAANGKDPDIKAFAAKTAPTVQMHLDAINKIHDSMK